MSLAPKLNKRIRNTSDEEDRLLKKTHTILQKEPQLIGELYNLESSDHIPIPHKESIFIGRSRQCDIILKGVDISTKHCELVPIYNQVTNILYLNIIDHSSNGTYINGLRVSNESRLLKDGDKVGFAKSGSYVFRYLRNDDSDKENVNQEGKEPRSTPFSDHYILGKELGSGHYATVNEAISRRTGKSYAVKIFKPQKIDDVKRSQKFNQELSVLMDIQHENIVKFHDRFVEPINKYSITTYLILEKVNSGELFTRIVNKKCLREDETKAIFKQLFQGLRYLHQKDIIHRDIKAENVLLNIKKRSSPHEKQTGPWDEDEIDVEVKIADFGLAKFIGELNFTNTLCGTPSYVAPEVLSSQRQYSKNVDLWSAGVLLYVCLSGFPPFSDELGPPSMRDQIIQVKYAFYSPFFDQINDSALDLISRLLVKDPEQRLTVQHAISHFWFNDVDSTSAHKILEPNYQITREPTDLNRIPKTYSELSKMEVEN